MSEADTACFTAKEQGRNRVFAFHDATTSQYMRQTSRGWLKRINDAMAEGAFSLHYPPIGPIDGPRNVGTPRFEALLRMSETGGELILPMNFIPVAERYDLMRTIDRWVVDRAFSDYRRLAKLRGNAAPAEFSINLSGHTLSSPEFAEFMQEKFAQYGVPPQCLFFEITETAAIASFSQANRFIQALKELGCKFALDDFGTGLSSFGYLKHFPVDFLKIDGSFVKEILHDPIDREMVRSINEIGHLTGKLTIAEFAENAEIITMLKNLGVDYAQGYGIASPQRITRSAVNA